MRQQYGKWFDPLKVSISGSASDGKKHKSITNSYSFGKFSKNHDINNDNKPFSGMNEKQVLTDSQISAYYQTGYPYSYLKADGTPDTSTISKDTFSYSEVKTIGFYQLRNSFAKAKDAFNVYVMVSDANAPKLLHGMTEADKKPYSVYMNNNKDFFDSIKEQLPKKDSRAGQIKDWIEANNGYWKWRNTNVFGTKKLDSSAITEISNDLYDRLRVIFGLENPYEKNTIVFARRRDWKT